MDSLDCPRRAFALQAHSLIAAIILGGICLALFSTQGSAQLQKSKQDRYFVHVRQIALCCKVYSSDYDGAFPDGDAGTKPAKNANEALQPLIKEGYIPDDTLFYIEGSAWCSAYTRDKTLAKGENAWAYFAGLTDTNAPDWPLLADAWAPGTEATYETDPTRKGGLMGAQTALVVFIDMSGKIAGLDPDKHQYITAGEPDGQPFNQLWPDAKTGWLGKARPLLPEE